MPSRDTYFYFEMKSDHGKKGKKISLVMLQTKHNKICTFNLETGTVNVINNSSGKAVDALWI